MAHFIGKADYASYTVKTKDYKHTIFQNEIEGGSATAARPPERELLSAVLGVAIGDLLSPKPRDRAMAVAFFQDEDESLRDEKYTFRFICNHLDLDPSAILKALENNETIQRVLKQRMTRS